MADALVIAHVVHFIVGGTLRTQCGMEYAMQFTCFKITGLPDLMEKDLSFLLCGSGQTQFSASLCKLVEKKKKLKAPTFEKQPTQQVGSDYGAQNSGFGVADASSSYYQGAVSSTKIDQSFPGSPYSENYQQPIDSSIRKRLWCSYYPILPAPQAQHISLPHSPKCSFQLLLLWHLSQVLLHLHLMLVLNKPPGLSFPANVPSLRNAQQSQQPTWRSQLYPGTATSAYNPVQPQLVLKDLYIISVSALPPRPRSFLPHEFWKLHSSV
ncbi:hypothetical protein NC651_021493 [Populus alba x Populus x berolinensis]|nr:hypothetical protein NC651_021493 [Populus alba x Populus x berolinensis]